MTSILESIGTLRQIIGKDNQEVDREGARQMLGLPDSSSSGRTTLSQPIACPTL